LAGARWKRFPSRWKKIPRKRETKSKFSLSANRGFSTAYAMNPGNEALRFLGLALFVAGDHDIGQSEAGISRVIGLEGGDRLIGSSGLSFATRNLQFLTLTMREPASFWAGSL
jgi:hypothetical protein